MSKRLIASFTLAAFAGTVLPVSAISESPTKASRVEGTGKVLVQRDGSWQPVSMDSLDGISRVRTGQDGIAVVSLADGSVIRLAANTQVDLSAGNATVKLERGRLLGKAGGAISVSTDRTLTKASKGEFVVFTSESGTKLEALSGNANLVAQGGIVRNADSEVDPGVFQGDNLERSQYHGDVSMLDDQWKGNWKGKGTGTRSDDSDEAVGGKQTTSPDTSVNRPIERPPVDPPAEPPVDPPVSNTPPAEPPVSTTPPTTTSPPPAVGGGGFPVIGVVFGGLAIGGLIAALANNDDDDEPLVTPPIVPSPSLP